MKKVLLAVIAAIVAAVLPHFSHAQSPLTKIWEHDRNFHNNDAGWFMETYFDAGSQTTQAVTLATVNDYSALNVTKWSEEGTMIYTKTVDLVSHSYWTPSRLILDADGNALIGGSTYDSEKLQYEIFVAKLNSKGTIDWMTTFSDENQYLLFSGLDGDGTGNYFLSLWYIEYLLTGEFKSVVETIKIDGGTGNTLWESELEFENQYVAINKSIYYKSGIYMTGYTTNASNFGYDFLTLKQDDQGNLSWKQTYSTGDPLSYATASDLAVNSDGEVVVVGTTDVNRLTAVGYSAEGNQEFVYERPFSKKAYIYGPQVESSSGGATYIGAQVYGFTASKIYLAQLNNDGSKNWEEFITNNYLTRMKIDPPGHSVSLLGSYFDLNESVYESELHCVDETGTLLFTQGFPKYTGYNGVSDFSTLDGKSYYLAGSVQETQFYTDQMSSRWDVDGERWTNSSLASFDAMIYPNPCSDFAYLDAGSNVTSISVFDIYGHMIAEFFDASEVIQLNTTKWKAGAYLVNITIGGEQKTIKLLKQ